jgi:hypothetical protein
MLFTDKAYVGVDTTSGHKAFTYAAIDRDLNLIALAESEMEDVTAFLGGQKNVTVAINSPSHVNTGLVRKNLEKQTLPSHQLRGVELRVAEYELRERGIVVGATSSRPILCPAWVQIGFALYARLSKLGFKPYPDELATHQWLETHPHACFCALLGRSPLPKPALEGRIQRALVLFERGVRIKDPMTFFEEITRHRLLNGILPSELMYLPEQLDALVAAYTAWLAAEKPSELTRLGNKQEGFITLPTSALKEKY